MSYYFKLCQTQNYRPEKNNAAGDHKRKRIQKYAFCPQVTPLVYSPSLALWYVLPRTIGYQISSARDGKRPGKLHRILQQEIVTILEEQGGCSQSLGHLWGHSKNIY